MVMTHIKISSTVKCEYTREKKGGCVEPLQGKCQREVEIFLRRTNHSWVEKGQVGQSHPCPFSA